MKPGSKYPRGLLAALGLCLLLAAAVGLVATPVDRIWAVVLILAAMPMLIPALAALGQKSGNSPLTTDETEQDETQSSPLAATNLSSDRPDLVFRSLNEAIFIATPAGKIQEANPAAGELLGQPPEALVGIDIHSLLTVNDRRSVNRQEGSRAQEALIQRSDGSLVTVSYTRSAIGDDDGSIQAQIYAAQNIDERKQVEKRIRYLARVDALTKMANRMQFQHQLQQAIARARRDQHYIAILYLDVDRFKEINDSFGHAAGDSSLETFSQRIYEVLPPESVPGRLAGDEFCILLKTSPGLESLVSEVYTIGGRLLRAVSRPFKVGNEEIIMTTSIGAAIYPRDGDNVVDLIRNADAALYQAKKAGGNRIEFFDEHFSAASEERLVLKSRLRRAFNNDELTLVYQPKYRLSDGRITGAEALVRWSLPDGGVVLPTDFIPIAEESNLIVKLGEWVLDRVCIDFRVWQRVMPSPCRVSVNLSLRQLQQQRFIERVRAAFNRHKVSPACFEFEITESTLMNDVGRTVQLLDALYGMGVRLAIDDFGTGYSSLSALQQFPISTLKIDRYFVSALGDGGDNSILVKTIIQMARNLKLDVVAEGVENEMQLDFLRANGCDIVQGHLFGDPMSANEFRDLLVADAEGEGRYRALFA
ncbi:MAG: EAL domain-containing protein [Gammaproteobacteria bacterium]|jgi:diguanylate cyclase (GGDEF)-like protein/PAS domain S-box-containing protein